MPVRISTGELDWKWHETKHCKKKIGIQSAKTTHLHLSTPCLPPMRACVRAVRTQDGPWNQTPRQQLTVDAACPAPSVRVEGKGSDLAWLAGFIGSKIPRRPTKSANSGPLNANCGSATSAQNTLHRAKGRYTHIRISEPQCTHAYAHSSRFLLFSKVRHPVAFEASFEGSKLNGLHCIQIVGSTAGILSLGKWSLGVSPFAFGVEAAPLSFCFLYWQTPLKPGTRKCLFKRSASPIDSLVWLLVF